jgi:chromosome segregation protein
LNELSGGEKTLLAMNFILSTAAFKRRSLYIFDEVDAALDEINSKRLATLINSMLGSSQVICVSHNQNFSKQGAREIQITKEGLYSKVAKIVERSN